MDDTSMAQFIVILQGTIDNKKRGIGTMITSTKLITVADVVFNKHRSRALRYDNIYVQPVNKNNINLKALTIFSAGGVDQAISMPVLDYIMNNNYEYASYVNNAAILIVSYYMKKSIVFTQYYSILDEYYKI